MALRICVATSNLSCGYNRLEYLRRHSAVVVPDALRYHGNTTRYGRFSSINGSRWDHSGRRTVRCPTIYVVRSHELVPKSNSLALSSLDKHKTNDDVTEYKVRSTVGYGCKFTQSLRQHLVDPAHILVSVAAEELAKAYNPVLHPLIRSQLGAEVEVANQKDDGQQGTEPL
uniref:Uncharacterized protein C12G12.11c n=1 Tax=Lygus hesperus TaxID=30085 RepID=A0A0A9Z7D3_LYGHE